MRQLLLFLLLLTGSITLSSQISNDSCTIATVLTVNSACTPVTYNSTGAVNSLEMPAPTCGIYKGSDAWFSFTVPVSGIFAFDFDDGTLSNVQIAMYNGICGSLSQLFCTGSQNDVHVFSDLSLAGSTIYLRVFQFNNDIGGTFDLCVFEPVIPTNNTCTTAQAISSTGSSCTKVPSTNLYATDSGDGSPTCGIYKGGDVWFTTTVPASGQLVIEDYRGTNNSPVFSVYSGNCGSLTNITCKTNGNNEVDGYARWVLNDVSLAGTTLFIQVFTFNDKDGNSFEICAYEPTIPAYDFCASAVDLGTPVSTCTPVTYTNEYFTATSGVGSSSCGIFKGGDAWFKLTVPASGRLVIEATDGTNINPVTSLFSGTCASLTEVDCRTNGSSTNDGLIVLSDPTLAGTVLYLRVFTFNSPNGGTFNLCLFEPAGVPNDLCSNAIGLGTPGATCTQTTYTNEWTTSTASTAPNPSCGLYKGGDVWFTVTVPVSGKLVIDAYDNVNTAIVLSLYSGTCGSFTEIDCRTTGSPDNAGRIVVNDLSLAGTLVYLRAFTFNNRLGGSFDLCLFEPSTPANDFCANAVALGTPTTTVASGNYNNLYCTSSAVASNASCGLYKGGDVWFTINVPASGQLVIDAEAAGIVAVLSLYTGTCGSFTEYDCRTSGSSTSDGRIIVNDISLAGATLYLRMHRLNTRNGGNFDLSYFEPSIAVNDFCASAIDLGVPGPVCSMNAYSNEYATEDPSDANPSCGLFKGGDIWFKLTVPPSGTLEIDSDPGAFNPVLTLYTGTCGSLTEYTCNTDGSGGRIDITDASLAGTELYLRVNSFNNRSGGSFDLCIADPARLPVELSSFEVTTNASNVQLKWNTETEHNTQQFEVLKSSDGFKFETIGTVIAAVNSTTSKTYSFVDESPLSGTSYYQLKIVDLDGTEEFSAIRSIQFNSYGNSVWINYSDFANPVLQLGKEADEHTEIIIYSVEGGLLFRSKIPFGIKKWEIPEHIPKLIHIYFVQVRYQTDNYCIKGINANK